MAAATDDPTPRDSDAVDQILRQWAIERPDLDVSAMGVIGRISRASTALDQQLRPVFAAAGLAAGDFDVLATLRRSGAPFRLTPTQLSDSTMVTSGAVTKRLDRLERDGLVTRTVSAADGRGRTVELTDTGRDLVDAVVEKHAANEERLLSPLSAKERDQLAGYLRRVLVGLEDAGELS